jgi:hypothetical protein
MQTTKQGRKPANKTEELLRDEWGRPVYLVREYHPSWDTKKYLVDFLEDNRRILTVPIFRHVPRGINFQSPLLREENVVREAWSHVFWPKNGSGPYHIIEDVKSGRRPYGQICCSTSNPRRPKFSEIFDAVKKSDLPWAQFKEDPKPLSTSEKFQEGNTILEFCVRGSLGEVFDLERLAEEYGPKSLLSEYTQEEIADEIEELKSALIFDYLGKIDCYRLNLVLPTWLHGLLYGEPVENSIGRTWSETKE